MLFIYYHEFVPNNVLDKIGLLETIKRETDDDLHTNSAIFARIPKYRNNAAHSTEEVNRVKLEKLSINGFFKRE